MKKLIPYAYICNECCNILEMPCFVNGKCSECRSESKEILYMNKTIPLTAEQLAREFHETYEKFAENNGWNTKKNCKTSFEDLPKKNKETMIDTCQHILLWIDSTENY